VNGAQHYAEGERLLAVAETLDWQDPNSRERNFAHLLLDAAQARFLAALVASTVDTSEKVRSEDIAIAWGRVLA
jgi:hypothetical protein